MTFDDNPRFRVQLHRSGFKYGYRYFASAKAAARHCLKQQYWQGRNCDGSYNYAMSTDPHYAIIEQRRDGKRGFLYWETVAKVDGNGLTAVASDMLQVTISAKVAIERAMEDIASAQAVEAELIKQNAAAS